MIVRRRPLTECSLPDMLLAAASEKMSGSIEIRAAISGIICLEEGHIFFAALDRAPLPELRESEDLRRSRLQGEFVAALAALSGQQRGWYFTTPHRPQLGGGTDSILFDVEDLLAEVETRLERCVALSPWGGHLVDHSSPDEPEVTLDRDMWELVGALVAPAAVHQLVDRTGWAPERIAATLDRLGAAHLVTSPSRPSRQEPATGPAPRPERAGAGPVATTPAPAPSLAAPLEDPEPAVAGRGMSSRDAIGQLRTLSNLASAAAEVKVRTGATQMLRVAPPRPAWDGSADLTIRRLPPPTSVVDTERTALPAVTSAGVVEAEGTGARKKALARLIASLKR